MLNKIQISGVLINEIKFFEDNQKSIGRMAHNKFYKTKSGEWKERSLFIDLDFWKENAIEANKTLKKGSKIEVEGELSLDEWRNESNEYKSRYYIKVNSFTIIE